MKYRDFYKHLLVENDSDYVIAYHSGPYQLDVSDIQFDLQSLGFHVGTQEQAEYVASGKTKKGRGLPISKFKVFESVGKLYMTTIEHDMAWEHADVLLVEFVHDGELHGKDAHQIVDLWDDLSSEQIDELHTLIDMASRNWGNSNFYPMDKFDAISLRPDVYKNREKLSFIRHALVEQGIGAIKYKNEVEGNRNEYSICILDKSMIVDVD